MTGQDILTQALSLLAAEGSAALPGGEGLRARGLPYLNQLAAEWWATHEVGDYPALGSMHAPLPLPDAVCRTVLPYGLAMLLAGATGDADRQAVFAAAYDARRAAAQTGRVADVFPRPVV